jgi:hypothetical protein
MRQIAVLTSLVALAGCQTIDTQSGLSFGANTGQLSHRFANVYLGKAIGTGFSHTIYFTEVFRNVTNVGVHLTNSQLCYVASNECFDMEYDITVGPNQSASYDSNVSTNDPTGEGYTETYFGSDFAGNPVGLTVIFRAGAYSLTSAGSRTQASPQASAAPQNTPWGARPR